MDPENRTLFEAHFQIGLYLKETFIPQAIKFYLNYSKFPKSGYASTHDSVAKSKTKPAAVTPTKNLVKSTIPSTSKCSRTKTSQFLVRLCAKFLNCKVKAKAKKNCFAFFFSFL